MVKLWNIDINEQTHAECQGFAPDDHIDKECYTVIITDQQEQDEIQLLLEEIRKITDADLEARIAEWQTNNPSKQECNCQGEEFIGCRWVYDSGPRESDSLIQDWMTDAAKMVTILAQFRERLG